MSKAKFFKGAPQWANDENGWLHNHGKPILDAIVLVVALAVFAGGLIAW